MQATALVAEFLLRLNRSGELKITDRHHFKRLAARMMRQIMIEYYRKKKTHGGPHVPVMDYYLLAPPDNTDYLDLENALQKLQVKSPRQAQVVDLHIYAGCTLKETAEILGITEDRANLDFKQAKVALRRILETAPQT